MSKTDWNVIGPELLASIQGVMPTLERIEAAHQHAHPQQIQNVREAVAKAAQPAQEPVVQWVQLWNDGGVTVSTWRYDGAGIIASRRVVLTPGQFDHEDTPSEWDRAIDAAMMALDPLCTVHTPKAYDSALMDVEAALLALKRGNGHA